MSTFSETLRKLTEAYPETATSANAIAVLDAAVGGLPFEPFFEPVSLTLVSKGTKPDALNGTRQLLDIGCDELASWTRHIAYGTRCRLRNLEHVIVEHLSQGHALPGMILLRSHVEASALAAYCLAELTTAVRQRNPEGLGELMAATLFGTALKKHRTNAVVADFLQIFEGDTIRICAAVTSLDKFYYQEHAEGKLAVAYSLLCEYAHPNHRGCMDFMVASEQAGGWEIRYGLANVAPTELIVGAADTLLISMRGGYAAGELLRCWQFSEPAGQLACRGPSPDQGKVVWEDLLQRTADGAA